MDKYLIKCYSEAYDKIYNLNSKTRHQFNDFENILINKVKLLGYEFKLNERTQFKLIKIKEMV